MRLNRVFLLTSPGPAAIAVVRIVGPRVVEFLERHFSKPARAGKCVHGILKENDEVIDDPLVVLSSDAAHADINLHGGAWVIEATLQLAKRAGFELVDSVVPLPDEAIDATSVLEREMLANLPLARTREALAMLLAQPAAWEKIQPGDAAKILADKSLWWMLNPPRVAIVGAPNVGKSTLANQLFASQRSITADVAGTTRDWVGELANIDGLAVMLVDTPGMRETDDAIEAEAIERSAEQVKAADLILRVIDASLPFATHVQANEIRVLNKSDKTVVRDAAAIKTVATTGEGVDALRLEIRSRFDCADFDPHRPRCWTPRQWEVLQRMMS